MKRILNFLIVVMATVLPMMSCGQSKKSAQDAAEEQPGKAVVCYFSATGTTEKAAQQIAELLGADVIEIVPAQKYTDADLDWRDSLSRSSVEMHDPTSRPALKDSVTDLSPYTVVYLGYPNWWNTHPTIINTFIEANDLKGKTIVPFMTSGGSDIANSEKQLKEQYPDLTFGDGLLMNGKTTEEIRAWLEKF